MDLKEILKTCDHTLLSQSATWEEIRALCDDGIRYECASLCIPPSFVRQAKEYVCDRIAICTVIGFPNGYLTTATKVFETKDAVANGADEIDMVINIGWVKEGKYRDVEEEIRKIRKACEGKILKVIFETCMLTDEEIVKLCECCMAAGADFVKTSTGFAAEGATFAAVELMKKTVGDSCRIKAAGRIRNIEDAEKFLALGATRLGTSRIVKLAKTLD